MNQCLWNSVKTFLKPEIKMIGHLNLIFESTGMQTTQLKKLVQTKNPSLIETENKEFRLPVHGTIIKNYSLFFLFAVIVVFLFLLFIVKMERMSFFNLHHQSDLVIANDEPVTKIFIKQGCASVMFIYVFHHVCFEFSCILFLMRDTKLCCRF